MLSFLLYNKVEINLNVFNRKLNRKIFIVTSVFKNKKIKHLQKKGIKFIYIRSLNSKSDFLSMIRILKKNNINIVKYHANFFYTDFTLFCNSLLNYEVCQKSQKSLSLLNDLDKLLAKCFLESILLGKLFLETYYYERSKID